MLRNFASHSQPLKALIGMNFWSTRTIVEDGHQYWRSLFYFEGKYLRGYVFGYSTGRFHTDLLEKISHIGADKKVFSTHKLDYYDQVGDQDLFSQDIATVKLPGTWTYYSVATAISSDNTLVTLASSAYKTKIENKLNSYLAKVGIRQGSAVFTFTEAGEFTITNGTKQIASGTYTVDKENNVEMKFGKVYSYLTLKGKLAATTSGCQILFNADKFLEFLKKAVAVAGKLISTDSLASLLSDASGLQLGFILTK